MRLFPWVLGQVLRPLSGGDSDYKALCMEGTQAVRAFLWGAMYFENSASILRPFFWPKSCQNNDGHKDRHFSIRL